MEILPPTIEHRHRCGGYEPKKLQGDPIEDMLVKAIASSGAVVRANGRSTERP